MRHSFPLVLVLVLALAAVWSPAAETTAPRLPEGSAGIAGKYPGDKGIEKDPAVVLAEDFEAESMEAVKKRYDSVAAGQIMSLSDDVPAGAAGKRSLLMTHVGGQNTGGHLYKLLGAGYDKLHYRFYVKFDEDCGPIHHFFHVGGYNPPTRWPQGGAGERPRGNDRVTTGVEPFGDSWRWDLYSYWMEMGGSPPRGQTWGNCFFLSSPVKADRGRWTCAEVMMKLNDVGDSNGEQALWIDGKLVGRLGKGFPRGKWTYDKFLSGQGGAVIRWDDAKNGPVRSSVDEGGTPFEGFRFRGDERLKLNFLWVLLYVTKSPKDHVSKVWFDQIVVAKEYIGPIK